MISATTADETRVFQGGETAVAAFAPDRRPTRRGRGRPRGSPASGKRRKTAEVVAARSAPPMSFTGESKADAVRQRFTSPACAASPTWGRPSSLPARSQMRHVRAPAAGVRPRPHGGSQARALRLTPPAWHGQARRAHQDRPVHTRRGGTGQAPIDRIPIRDRRHHQSAPVIKDHGMAGRDRRSRTSRRLLEHPTAQQELRPVNRRNVRALYRVRVPLIVLTPPRMLRPGRRRRTRRRSGARTPSTWPPIRWPSTW